MRVPRRITLIALVLLVGACRATGALDHLVSALPSPVAAKGDFNGNLARGYDMLAEYAAYIEGDAAATARYQDKAARAKSGADVAPDLPPDNMAGKEAADLTKAHGMLDGARRAADSRTKEPVSLAEAQVNYECWLARSVAGHDGADGCRRRFFDAMDGLTLPSAAQQTFSIFFEPGDAIPGPDGMETIRRAAAAYTANPEWHVRLSGHSDRKGSREANMMLSMRRAVAVRNALAQNGVDPDSVAVEALGADKGTDDPDESRRVDIHVSPPWLDHPSPGPDIHKIMPHYFGTGDPDF